MYSAPCAAVSKVKLIETCVEFTKNSVSAFKGGPTTEEYLNKSCKGP